MRTMLWLAHPFFPVSDFVQGMNRCCFIGGTGCGVSRKELGKKNRSCEKICWQHRKTFSQVSRAHSAKYCNYLSGVHFALYSCALGDTLDCSAVYYDLSLAHAISNLITVASIHCPVARKPSLLVSAWFPFCKGARV